MDRVTDIEQAARAGHKPSTPSRVSGWVSCTGATGFVTFTVYEDRIVGHVTDTLANGREGTLGYFVDLEDALAAQRASV